MKLKTPVDPTAGKISFRSANTTFNESCDLIGSSLLNNSAENCTILTFSLINFHIMNILLHFKSTLYGAMESYVD